MSGTAWSYYTQATPPHSSHGLEKKSFKSGTGFSKSHLGGHLHRQAGSLLVLSYLAF
jgi:hypothetical protein